MPPTVAEGATGPTVQWAQYLTVRRTLSYDQIDGIVGPTTWAISGHAADEMIAGLCGVPVAGEG